jgi:hypothetical protein
VFQQARAELIGHLATLSGESLLAPIDHEQLADVAPTIAHLPAFISFHEGTHAGQVLIIRRALGLPRALGM